MQLQDALALFLDQLRADGRSKHTIAQYKRQVTKLARWAASIGLTCEIDEIDHVVLARFMGSPDALQGGDGRDKTPATVNALRSSLRVFFGYLADADYLVKSPARLIKRARCGAAPPRGLSKRESEALMATIAAAPGPLAQRDHALFSLLLATGIRVGSAVALEVRDLDLDEGVMELRVMKGGRAMRVALGEETVRRLAALIEGRDRGPVFVGREGLPLSRRHVARRFREWVVAAGIKRPVTAHSLRHTFALEMYERTRDIFAVQRALGHRSIVSTVGYAQSLAEGCPGEPLGVPSIHERREHGGDARPHYDA